MHLLRLKEMTGLAWDKLARMSGIPEGNLHRIAHARKGWGPETAAKLRSIGVDMNEQTEFHAREVARRNARPSDPPAQDSSAGGRA